MISYQYQILRYCHDQFSREFVILGVVVFSPDKKYLKAKFTTKYSRITGMFPDANGKFILSSVRAIATNIRSMGKLIESGLETPESLQAIMSKILIPDDSSLQFSELKSGIDLDMNSALSYLFQSKVEKYVIKTSHVRHSDEDVWKKVYKNHFDELKISKRFSKHTIKTDKDQFTFARAWKNEIWHSLQPISFDLKEKDSIKNKVYNWAGKIGGLQNAKERLHLTFLTAIPDEYTDMKEFIVDYLDKDSDQVTIDVILEDDAAKVAEEFKIMIMEHDKHKGLDASI